MARTCATANFVDLDNACNGTSQGSSANTGNGGGPWTTPAADGETINVPSAAINVCVWGVGQTLIVTVNLKIIGNGSSNTIITCSNTSGRIIELNTISSDNTAILRGIQFAETIQVSNPDLSKPTLLVWGKSRVHWNGSNYVGGFWLDDVIWTATASGPTKNAHLSIGSAGSGSTKPGFVSGLVSHCKTVFGSLTPVALGETTQISCQGSPTGVTPNWNTPAGTPGILGEYSWFQPYTPGGITTSDPGNTFVQAVYVEDCIFDTVLDSLGGGGRFVFRHNTMRRALERHGCETGNNTGCSFTEDYNNYFNLAPFSSTGQPYNCDDVRSGSDVAFNNIYSNTGSAPIKSLTFARLAQTGAMIGVADGKNFFDLNERGTVAGITPISVPADTRLGAVYATNLTPTNNVTITAGKQYTVDGLDGGLSVNKWAGFAIRNLTYASPDSKGSQLKGNAKSYCKISASTATNPCTITLSNSTGTSNTFVLAATDPWEITRVHSMAFGPGCGPTSFLLNGGNVQQAPLTGALLVDALGNVQAPPNPTWVDAGTGGIWTKNLLYRTGVNGSFSAVPANSSSTTIPGAGIVNGYPTGYPTNNTAPYLRIGADIADPSEQATASEGAGATYPHPFRGAATGRIILLSGNMTFPNTVVGQTSTSTLTIFNNGDTDFSVTSITYPTGFSGAYSGTVTAGTNQPVTVTFTPVSAISYSGTITVNAVTDSGSNTIAASGTGTPPLVQGSAQPEREKSVARRVTAMGRRT